MRYWYSAYVKTRWVIVIQCQGIFDCEYADVSMFKVDDEAPYL